MPILSSGGPHRTPLVFIGRMNAVMPLWPAARSFIVNSTQTSATGPLVIQFLVPLITQSLPSRSAVVFCAAASLPASGSDSAKQPSILPDASGTSHCCFCASVANRRIGSHTSELLTLMMTPVDAHARETSSIASAYDTLSRPAPPFCSGTAMPSSPSWAMRWTSSVGWRCSRSISAALGNTSLVANSRAMRIAAVCSSVGENSTVIPSERLSLRLIRSFTLELRRAPRLGEECRHPLALVGGREQKPEAALLEAGRGLERRRLAVVDQTLALGDRERAVGGDPPGQISRLGEQLAVRPHRVGQADAQGLGGVDRVAGHAQFLGLGDTDAAGEALRAAKPRDDAELDLGLAELGL